MASPSSSLKMTSPSSSLKMTSPSPSPTTVPFGRFQNPSKKAVNPSFSDLPSSLLEIIMSRLVLRDNIRASAACKTWHEAAVYVRVVDKHPWLLYLPKRGGGLIKLHDPLECKWYTLNLPELAKSTVCYSRDGWLLLHRFSSREIFFFNPFSRELITLPKFELPFQKIVFSSAPKTDNCVVVALNSIVGDGDPRMVSSTCHPGATEWITTEFRGTYRPFDVHTKIVHLNDRLYCFHDGFLYSFHPSSRKWYFDVARYLCQERQWMWNEKLFFLAEKKGELFLVFTRRNGKPIVVYKLVSYQWTEMSRTELDGLTIFVSFYNSELRSDLPWMRNNIYFSRFNNRMPCVSYSFDDNTPRERQNWLLLCPPHRLWIDQPKNVLDYL